MATLSVKGLDESLIAQLRTRAECLNTDIDELVKSLIMHGLNSLQLQKNGDYDALDQLVGLCETGIADASAHHDSRIYTKNKSS
ncbi:hypothetical protein [Candidatus Electrothrix sp.]|uniref:hypothetical protein n=1 Tax=Candidatus Electrothrix sp. TaxID=2170559 RepID=UPI004055E1D8